MDIDVNLLEYCTPIQRMHLETAIKLNSMREADKALDKSVGSTSAIHKAVKVRAAKVGYAPEAGVVRPMMEGFELKRVSTLARNELGEPQWQIQEQSKARQAEAMRDYVKGLCKEIEQAKPTKDKIKKYQSELMPSIFIGDAHIGMKAFGKETKHHNFDTDIAVQQLRDAVDYLVDKADVAETGLLVDVGDYTHADGHHNQTTAGTSLDVDTRHRHTMYEAAMCMRYMISKMLEKCKNLVVVIARGNHNDNVAPAIELMLSFYYENEPRVTILETNGYFHYLEYGKWLIGVCHGDKQKPESLVPMMAADMPQAWGRTSHRLWATGHYHKEATKTLQGCKHKIFAALPPPDAWHSSRGFKGDGEMEMLTFRKEGGIQSSHVYNILRPIVEPDITI